MIREISCRANLGVLIWTTERLPQFDWSRGFAFPFNDTLVLDKDQVPYDILGAMGYRVKGTLMIV